MFTSTLMGHYIPVTWLTFGLDYTLWGMNPFGYHLTNNLIHAANAALFYLIALRLLGKATSLTGPALRAAGAMAALFFALHPLRAESVAWATERRDVLSGLFFLLTILAVPGGGRRRGRARGGGSSAGSVACLCPRAPVQVDRHDTAARPAPARHLPARAAPVQLGHVAGDAGPGGLEGEAARISPSASPGPSRPTGPSRRNNFLTASDKYGWPARIAIAGYSLWFYVEKTARAAGAVAALRASAPS